MTTKVSLLVMALILCSPLVSGQKVQDDGVDWLADHCPNAPEVKLSGVYRTDDWGRLTLALSADGKSLKGRGDGWDIIGRISGTRVCLIFARRNKVAYSAILTAESETRAAGSYRAGLMEPDDRRVWPINLRK
jgi:hypothetical protein